MADEDHYKSLDAGKTVLIRPGSSVQHSSAATDDTRILGGRTETTHPSGGAPDEGTLRINPQSPLGEAMTGGGRAETMAQPEADHTRVIRPSVAPAPDVVAAQPAAVAASDLGTLEKEGPVVGWFVVVKGPGKGLFRPIYYGNNTIGRDKSQRVPLNFGDDAISSEEQAYVRYDSQDRTYILIPNLAKSNLVSVNQQRPTEPVRLSYGDLIEVGQTRLLFVPLCSSEFDWADVEGQ
jgi:hypothetical protein